MAAAPSIDNRPTFYGANTTRVLVAILTPSSWGGTARLADTVSVRNGDPTADADSTCRAAWLGHDSIELQGCSYLLAGGPINNLNSEIKLLCDHKICAGYNVVETLCYRMTSGEFLPF